MTAPDHVHAPIRVSRAARWTGLAIGTVPALFLLVDAVMKFIKPEAVVKATTDLGFPASSLTGLGAVLLASTLLYLWPRTAVLGAVLLTAYLGGAVAAHVRLGDGQVFGVAFAVVLAVMLWGGLHLREPRLRAILPVRR